MIEIEGETYSVAIDVVASAGGVIVRPAQWLAWIEPEHQLDILEVAIEALVELRDQVSAASAPAHTPGPRVVPFKRGPPRV